MSYTNNLVLDLHNLNGTGNQISEQDVWLALDRFITKIKIENNKKINSGLHIPVHIIVGKGLKSKNLIQGKNPLRFYTESYLNLCNYSFKDGEYFTGQNGTIIAQII